MKSFILYSLFTFVLLSSCETQSKWLSFDEYFGFYDMVVNANIVRIRPNCGPKSIQIIPGDCRPVYKVKLFLILSKYNKVLRNMLVLALQLILCVGS